MKKITIASGVGCNQTFCTAALPHTDSKNVTFSNRRRRTTGRACWSINGLGVDTAVPKGALTLLTALAKEGIWLRQAPTECQQRS